jgi:ketosteroid isomerase-like protein
VSQSRDRVADELEIRSVVHRYADAASRRDAAAVASTFTADGQWQSPELGNYQGHDALVPFFTAMLQDWNAFIQGLQSGLVVFDAIDSDRATGRWFVQETGQRSEGTNMSVAGVYHDEYLRDAGEWRISHRRYDPLLFRADDAVTAVPFPADAPTLD